MDHGIDAHARFCGPDGRVDVEVHAKLRPMEG